MLHDNGKTIIIDNSGYSNIEECHRKADYYLMERRELDQNKDALVFGTNIHTALEARYRISTDMLSDVEQSTVFATLSDSFMTNPVSEANYRNLDYAHRLMKKYLSEYPRESFDIMMVEGKPQLEVTFALPLGLIGDIQVIITGKIDLIYRRGESYGIMDHKTSSVLGPTYYESLDMSTQPMTYLWAAKQIYGPPADIVFNVVGTRAPRKDGSINFEFTRHQIAYNPEKIEEWRQEVLTNIAVYHSLYQQGKTTRNTNQCIGKYGRCPYLDVCSLPKNQRMQMLQSNLYKDVTWNPLETEGSIHKEKPTTPNLTQL